MALEKLQDNTVHERNFRRLERRLAELERPLPAALMYNSAVQSVPNATATRIIYNTVVFEQGSIDADTATGFITIERPGLYHVWGSLYFPASSGTPLATLDKNNQGHADPYGYRQSGSGAGANDYTGNPNGVFLLAAGDTVGMQGFHTAGGAANLGFGSANGVQNKLGAVWLSP